ncbi:N-terminal EF-hand calcium-binding protein 1 [Pseudonaja textilis]|uniref:N-terminal EF-hand calcium-binding protein 1 n=1 Tax=Pseudonaja textilis TaxID=8673 RepID=UPI000EA8BF12|nr:N-terminal EF-hand calcium-binding protein 1 [Pseudonaja textilis]
MDDLKLLGKTKSELNSLIESTKEFSQDISMHFGIDKCAMAIKAGKVIEDDGIELENEEMIKAMKPEEGYKYLGILEASDLIHNRVQRSEEPMIKEILRRADKNDDGKLSFDEFKAYFEDGILSIEELHQLFQKIDIHNTDNLETEELFEYFSQHLGAYESVLSALEDLNVAILKAMDATKKNYQEASTLEQFVTRFLLKETLNQLQSLHNSLECAMETTEEQTQQEQQVPKKPEVLKIQHPGRRSGRRLKRNNSFSPLSPLLNPGLHKEDNQWMTQINRLQKLIDKLEQKDLKLEPLEEVSEGNTKSQIMIVQRQMSVITEELESFRFALKQYVDMASSQDGCLHVSIQKLSGKSCFIVYEFWENNAWNSHLQMNYSKSFQRSNVDCLETPENITTMLVPASWCILNN